METINTIRNIINPEWILTHGGIWLVLLIIFAETGLFLGFFLPGDSLLFITGMVLAKGGVHFTNTSTLSLIPCMVLIIFAGVLGNFVGYWFGYKSGDLLFQKKDSLFFKKKYLHQAQSFYDKNGASTIVIARFLPIIRTFAPIIAGIVKMNKKAFFLYNVIGCVVWVLSMVLLGFFLGRIFPELTKYLDFIVIGIIVITTFPVFYKIIKYKNAPVVEKK